MKNFNISYNENQEKELRAAGFPGIANDPDGLETVFYFKEQLEFLYTHNKNYTKKQYETIENLFAIVRALDAGI